MNLPKKAIKMDAKDPALDPAKPAYLVFDNEMVRVEIFLPTQEKSVVIRKSSEKDELPVWSSGPLTLTHSNNQYTLDDEGKILYQGPAPK